MHGAQAFPVMLLSELSPEADPEAFPLRGIPLKLAFTSLLNVTVVRPSCACARSVKEAQRLRSRSLQSHFSVYGPYGNLDTPPPDVTKPYGTLDTGRVFSDA
jgi:hypothetical protein